MMTVFCEVQDGARFRSCADKDEYKKISGTHALRYSTEGEPVTMKTETIFHPASAVILYPPSHVWEFELPWPGAIGEPK